MDSVSNEAFVPSLNSPVNSESNDSTEQNHIYSLYSQEPETNSTSTDQTSVLVDWKRIVHDDSIEPLSCGKMFHDIKKDPRIRQILIKETKNGLDQIVVENIWEEEFLIDLVTLPGYGKFMAQAVQIF